jgi:hypothetical protein
MSHKRLVENPLFVSIRFLSVFYVLSLFVKGTRDFRPSVFCHQTIPPEAVSHMSSYWRENRDNHLNSSDSAVSMTPGSDLDIFVKDSVVSMRQRKRIQRY